MKEIKSIADLVPDDMNANRHTERGLGMLDTSLEQFGAGRSVTVDKNGKIISGNATIERAAEKGFKVRVVQTDGKEIVVHQRIDLDLEKDPRARGLAIADNRVAEVDLDWDASQLALLDEIKLDDDISILDPFFFPEEKARLTNVKLDVVEDPTKPLPADEAQARIGAKLGDLFEIGGHRLLCGDSTKPDDVKRLFGSEKAVLLATDPPYGVDYGEIAKARAASGRGGKVYGDKSVKNDDLSGEALRAFLRGMLTAARPCLVEAPAFYFWHPMLTQSVFWAAAAEDCGIHIHRQIIWVKPSLILGRGDYHWRHELCFYGWYDDKRCRWLAGRDQDTVWEVNRDVDPVHPTQKPAELFARPIANHTLAGEIVYEPFSGSGSQLVAAEQAARRCFAIELDPKYVSVAVERMQQLGLKVTKS